MIGILRRFAGRSRHSDWQTFHALSRDEAAFLGIEHSLHLPEGKSLRLSDAVLLM
jgi:hypothetical protein